MDRLKWVQLQHTTMTRTRYNRREESSLPSMRDRSAGVGSVAHIERPSLDGDPVEPNGVIFE